MLLCVFPPGVYVGIKVSVSGIWAAWNDGTAEVVNNLLRPSAEWQMSVTEKGRERSNGLLTSTRPSRRTPVEPADAHYSGSCGFFGGKNNLHTYFFP